MFNTRLRTDQASVPSENETDYRVTMLCNIILRKDTTNTYLLDLLCLSGGVSDSCQQLLARFF